MAPRERGATCCFFVRCFVPSGARFPAKGRPRQTPKSVTVECKKLVPAWHRSHRGASRGGRTGKQRLTQSAPAIGFREASKKGSLPERPCDVAERSWPTCWPRPADDVADAVEAVSRRHLIRKMACALQAQARVDSISNRRAGLHPGQNPRMRPKVWLYFSLPRKRRRARSDAAPGTPPGFRSRTGDSDKELRSGLFACLRG